MFTFFTTGGEEKQKQDSNKAAEVRGRGAIASPPEDKSDTLVLTI
jgi:hypothetical protein